MNLRVKINLFTFLIFLTFSIVFVLTGDRVLEEVIYQQHYQLLSKKVQYVSEKIKAHPSDRIPRQPAFLKSIVSSLIGKDEQLLIAALDGKVILYTGLTSGEPFPPEFIREMLDQEQGTLDFNYKGDRRLSVFRSIPGKNRLVSISISYDEIFQKKSGYLIPFFLVVVGIFFLNILTLNYLIRGIVRRINAILDCTQKVSTGDLSSRIEETMATGDEIGSLQVSINQMIAKIEERSQTQLTTEFALKESEDRLNLALDVAKCALWEYNPTTNKNVHFGDRWFTMLGYSPTELPHSTGTWTGLMHPDDKAETMRLLQMHMEDKEVLFDAEFRMKSKNGGYQWIRSVGKVISKDEQGHPDRMIGLHMDVTERKESEFSQKEMELHLRRSQKIEAIGTLAGGIAHDFNNILSSILGYAEVIQDEIDKESSTYSSLLKIIAAGERAKALIYQIHTFSQRSEGEERPIQIAEVVKEILNLLQSTIPASIDIRLNLMTHASILGDPVQIHQVMVNLFTNAEYAMQGQAGTLTVSLNDVLVDAEFSKTLPDIKAGKYVKLSIGDTGCGMSQESIERIFDPFYTTKEKEEGTGLGLSIVHGIVRNHNGCITVNSNMGEGATFNIFFPVYEIGVENLQSTAVSIPGGTESILFIDDEATVLESGKLLMERLGYKVTTEIDSHQALERFKNKPDFFDLVITDMTMPQMTGDVLAEKMMHIRRDIPIILCTGYSARVNEKKSKEMGIRAFVNKPLLKWDMADTIRKVLDGKK